MMYTPSDISITMFTDNVVNVKTLLPTRCTLTVAIILPNPVRAVRIT
jgi:hypothetical protein